MNIAPSISSAPSDHERNGSLDGTWVHPPWGWHVPHGEANHFWWSISAVVTWCNRSWKNMEDFRRVIHCKTGLWAAINGPWNGMLTSYFALRMLSVSVWWMRWLLLWHFLSLLCWIMLNISSVLCTRKSYHQWRVLGLASLSSGRCRCPLGTRPKPKKLICRKHAFIHLPL